ncbi:hypothetical protein ABPG74_015722 [Tetrahymena malaccensis]
MDQPEMQRINGSSHHEDDIVAQDKFTCYQSCVACCGKIEGCLGMWLPFPCCCCPKPFVTVPSSSKGILEKFGGFQKVLEPGLHEVNPECEKVYIVDMKTKVLDLKRQTVMTNDNVTVDIDTVAFYRIVEPKKALYKIVDIKFSLEQLTYACLRSICGEHSLQDLLEKREQVNDQIENYVEEHVKDWGIFVEQVFIKDMILSKSLIDEMSMVPVSRKKAESKVISSKSDVESAKLLRQAADMLATDAAMQIRYFEVVQSISEHPNKKVVFLPLKPDEE